MRRCYLWPMTTTERPPSPDLDLDRTAACLEALGNPTRLAIYRLLVRAGGSGRSVGRIQEALSVPASTLSHHLKHLEMVGLVLRRREGTTHLCQANFAAMAAVLDFLTEECCREDAPPTDPSEKGPPR